MLLAFVQELYEAVGRAFWAIDHQVLFDREHGVDNRADWACDGYI